MKLLVLGATGATGQLVVAQGLAAGHSVRALVRAPEKVRTDDDRLEVVRGQATDPADIAEAMNGVDVVISTLGAAKGTVITDATRAVIAAAARTGVNRVVVLSSFAVVREKLSTPAKLMSGLAMGAVVRDKAAAEQLLASSGLDYTVVHAVRLTDGPATGAVKVLPDTTVLRLSDSISRADVAAWLLAAATGATVPTARAVAIAA